MGAPDDGVLLGVVEEEVVVVVVDRDGPQEEAEGDDVPMEPVKGPSDLMEVVVYREEAEVNQPAVGAAAHQQSLL
jgi:hypothetical protein